MASFPTSLAGEVQRGAEAGQFPGPDSAASPRGTPDFIDYGEEMSAVVHVAVRQSPVQ